MQKRLWILLFPILSLTACLKSNEDKCDNPVVNVKAPDAEIATLQEYITTAGITATKDPRGFFYNITAAGTGDKPNACSNAAVAYTGKLTNGTTFDSSNGVAFNLGGLILGWQEGIPLIAKGGSITLYLPPSLGYGSQGNGSIPANSILVFTINLLDFN